MNIVVYDPLQHYLEVKNLWERALGGNYPVTDRVLRPRICTRPTYEQGDGLVVVDQGRVIGFGINEIDRAPLVPAKTGTIQLILVDPVFQRRGIGRKILGRLETNLKLFGITGIMVGTGPYRFWSGIPDDMPATGAFFATHGYQSHYEAIDMVAPLDGFVPEQRYTTRLRDLSVSVEHVTGDTVGSVYDLLTRELPSWRTSMLSLVTAGDMDNILYLRHGSELVGCIQTFTPQSRFRGANVVWEQIYGGDMGGFGAVLIAKSWRDKGLGTCLCQAAAEHVKSRGARQCYIDWTSRERAPLYAKVGAVICKTFHMYGKKL